MSSPASSPAVKRQRKGINQDVSSAKSSDVNVKIEDSSSSSPSVSNTINNVGIVADKKGSSSRFAVEFLDTVTPKSEEEFQRVPTKEERRKDKKRKREEKLKVLNRPQFMFNTDGFKNYKRIGIAHIRDLVLHVVTEHTSPNWILVQHRSNVTHTVVALVPGLEMTDLGLDESVLTPNSYLPYSLISGGATDQKGSTTTNKNKLPALTKLFSVACPTRAPGDARRLFSVVQTLLQSPLSQQEAKKRESTKLKILQSRSEDAGDPTVYLLTPDQMADNEYPIPDYIPLPGDGSGLSTDEVFIPGRKRAGAGAGGKVAPSTQAVLDSFEKIKKSRVHGKGHGTGWRETPEAEKEPEDGKYKVLAIDCEMVSSPSRY